MGNQIIVELDAAMARELEAVAPARARQRSEFIRRAVRAALDRAAEERMRRGYQAKPDAEPAYFDPDAWETPAEAPRRPRPRGRKA
jgi:hypothetical protein